MLILSAPPHISAALPVQAMLQPALPSGAGTPGASIILSQSNEFSESRNFLLSNSRFEVITHSIPKYDTIRTVWPYYMRSMRTLPNSTPAYWYPAGVQKAVHDSIVMSFTSVKAAVRRVRLLEISLRTNIRPTGVTFESKRHLRVTSNGGPSSWRCRRSGPLTNEVRIWGWKVNPNSQRENTNSCCTSAYFRRVACTGHVASTIRRWYSGRFDKVVPVWGVPSEHELYPVE